MATNVSPAATFDPFSAGVASGFSGIFDQALGPGPRVNTPSPYEGRSITRTLMTAEYEGRAQMIKDTIEDYTLTSEQTFYTTEFMPFFRTDEIHVTWTEWQNKDTFMGPTPHLANSRVISRSRIIRKASMIRRGLAYEFEDDNLKTPGGRASFYSAMACIARSFIETCNVQVIRALRSCHLTDIAYVREYKLLPLDQIDEHLIRDKARFMIVQKEENGIEKMNTMADAEQRIVGGNANAWIGGEELSIYCTVVDPLKTLYYNGGQEAVDRLNGRAVGPVASGGTMDRPMTSIARRFTIQGQPFYTSKSYYVEGIGQSDLLSRIREVGIFNLMVDRTPNFAKYRSEGRNIRVYNNTTDAWSVITLADAIKHMPIWEDDGKVKPYGGGNEDDFLSFRYGPTRIPVAYIGDLSQNHIDVQHFIDGGITLLHAVANHDEQGVREIYKDFANVRARPAREATGERAAKPAVSLEAALREVVGKYADRIRALVGPDNVFELGGAAVEDVVLAGLKAVARDDQMTTHPVIVQSSIDHSGWLRSTIAAPFSDQHKAKADRLIRDSEHMDWEGRAKLLKTAILENLKDFAPFGNNPAHVDEWFNQRVANRREAIAARVAQTVGAGAGQGEVQYEYVPTNQPVAHTMRAFQRVGAGASGARVTLNPGRPGIPDDEQRERQLNDGYQGIYLPEREDPKTPSARLPAFTPTAGRGREPLAGFNARYTNMSYNLDAINKESAHPAVKAMAMLYAGIAFNRNRFLALIGAQIKVPLGALLCRPHATYRTRFAIKAATGGQTGFTMFGHSDLAVGHDSGGKKGFLHYTAYMSAVVVNPRNVVVMNDIYCAKYLGGMDVSFYTPAKYHEGKKRRVASILAFPLPPNVTEMDKDIDMRGKWYTHQKQGFITPDRYDRPMFPGADRMCDVWKFEKQSASAYSRVGEVPTNYTCSQGVQWHFNTTTSTWGDITIEQSVFGHKVYAGCGKVRNGESVYLLDPGYGMHN